MNPKNSLVSALCAFALVATASAASTPSSTLPVLESVVHPTGLPREYRNADVKITMTIDAQGVPHDLAPAGHMPEDLAKRLLPVVAQWRFSPAYENGRAVARKVVLPLTLLDEAEVAYGRRSFERIAAK